MGTGAGDPLQSAVILLLRYVDNAQLFLLQLSLAVIHQLENEPFVTKLKQVCQPEFAQYLGEIDPRNVTRYMNLAKIADFIARETGDMQEFKGFDYWRKILLDKGLASRQVEKGGGWEGFGGVHSHYTFTDVGSAFFNLQACLLVKPSIALGLYKQATSIETRGLTYLAAEMIILNRGKVGSNSPFSSSQAKALQSLMIGIIAYLGFLRQKQKEVLIEDLWSRVDFHFEGKMRKEDFNECLTALRDYVRIATTIKYTKEGEALFFFVGELIHIIEAANKDKVERELQEQKEEDIWKDGWKDWNLM